MSAAEAERLARAALCRLAEPGDPRLASLVSEIGAIRVRDHLAAERDLHGLRSDVAARLAAIDPEADLERAERRGIRCVVPGDDEWPSALDDLGAVAPLQSRGGVPLALWVRGPVRLSDLGRAVSVVGSRSATSYGADLAAEISAGLGRAGFGVVSGAAFGIDQAAHRGALGGGGATVAVLACGVDRAYPAAHKPLLDHLIRVGAVVSEAPPGCAPSRLRFLARNRMIAALTRGTVVVEAAVRSGALNTANWADRLTRVVMGVPGPVTSAASQGVHQLLRTGAATLVTAAEDVLELVGGAGEHLSVEPRAPARPRDGLSHRDQQILDAVPLVNAVGADSIARTAGIGLVEVGSALERLTGRGLVERAPSGWRLAPSAQG